MRTRHESTVRLRNGRRHGWKPALAFCACLLASRGAESGLAATLKPGTVQAWERYYQWADAKVEREVRDPARFLIRDCLSPADRAELQRKLLAGEAVIERMKGVTPAGLKFSVPDGEIHHWWGSVLVPGIRMPALLKFLQDYDNHGGEFADVEESRLLSRNGDHFEIFFRLRRTKAFVTAHYNTIQEATYYTLDSGRVYTRSVARKIAELEDAGSPEERERTPGDDRGYLWRLVSWWRLKETDQGVIVEIESATLSRDIPGFIRFIPGVSSYIRSTPRESMESVLKTIRSHFQPPK